MKTIPSSAFSRAWFGVALATILMVPAAHAHIIGSEIVGLTGGFEHPFLGWDHIVAMIALGIWGAQLGSPAVWVLPVTFPLAMAFGGFLGLIEAPIPGVEVGIAWSCIVLGTLVLTGFQAPLLFASIMVGVFALFYGYVHGAVLKGGNDALLYGIGFFAATGLLYLVGILLGIMHRWSAGRLILRGVGIVITATGIYFLWQVYQPKGEPVPPLPPGMKPSGKQSVAQPVR